MEELLRTIGNLGELETEDKLVVLNHCIDTAAIGMAILDEEVENDYELEDLRREIYTACLYAPIDKMMSIKNPIVEMLKYDGHILANGIINDALAICNIYHMIDSLSGLNTMYDKIKIIDCIETYKYYIPTTKYGEIIADLIFSLMQYINYIA